MRSNVMTARQLAASALALVFFGGAESAAAGTKVPVPVSPGAATAGAVSEARCPTFSWGGVAGAPGYELAVFRVSDGAAAEPELVTRVSLPADSRSWTPSVGRCLARGKRYAWSVAATRAEGAEGEVEWAPALLFEVETTDGAVVERPAAARQDRVEEGVADGSGADVISPREEGRARVRTREGAAGRDRRRFGGTPAEHPTPGALPLSAPGIARTTSPASTPSLEAASLAVSGQIHLAPASDLFKGGDVFLWDDASGNTALGRTALSSVSGTATNNTAVGRGALENTTGGAPFHGSDNTAAGTAALQANTTGRANTAIGVAALALNTTGYLNTASGVHSLLNNTTGRSNTANGAFSLGLNTTGSLNTASGVYALNSNSTGSFNTASGFSALRSSTTGTENTAAGSNALRYNTTGSQNTAIGTNALLRNTTGAFNSASGVRSLEANTTGHRNTAAGSYALFKNTAGFRNTAIGHVALFQNTTASYNTAFGAHALEYTTTGERNVAVGDVAGRGITTGHRNVLIGHRAGESMATGERNVVIGYLAGTGSTDSRAVVIGNEASGCDRCISIGQLSGYSNVARRIFIGNSAIHYGGTFIAGIHGAVVAPQTDAPVLVDSLGHLGTAASSRRVKRDIEDIGPVADRVLELRPVAFRYKQHVAEDPDTPRRFGLIAEEVAEVFPELVVFDEEGKPQTVKYHLLSSLLLGELQRQHGMLEEQRRWVERHEAENARLRARLSAVEARADRYPRRAGDRPPRGSR